MSTILSVLLLTSSANDRAVFDRAVADLKRNSEQIASFGVDVDARRTPGFRSTQSFFLTPESSGMESRIESKMTQHSLQVQDPSGTMELQYDTKDGAPIHFSISKKREPCEMMPFDLRTFWGIRIFCSDRNRPIWQMIDAATVEEIKVDRSARTVSARVRDEVKDAVHRIAIATDGTGRLISQHVKHFYSKQPKVLPGFRQMEHSFVTKRFGYYVGVWHPVEVEALVYNPTPTVKSQNDPPDGKYWTHITYSNFTLEPDVKRFRDRIAKHRDDPDIYFIDRENPTKPRASKAARQRSEDWWNRWQVANGGKPLYGPQAEKPPKPEVGKVATSAKPGEFSWLAPFAFAVSGACALGWLWLRWRSV